MALQGNLRDFSATEILQLLGLQQKSGCLLLERGPEHVRVYVLDGRIVSTRPPGMTADDPLLKFLLKIHRLSSEQHLGIAAIHKSSARDLEDVLINGRYLEPDELAMYLERQILDDVTRVVRWETGSYRFEAEQKWTQPVQVRMGTEATLIEAARRTDESRRTAHRFQDREALLGVRDLPDPDEPLSDEERELFGIIDGRHTAAEVVAAAPLTDSEAYEALARMLEANWIEFVGRRESSSRAFVAPAAPAPAAPAPAGKAPVVRHAFLVEVGFGLAVLVVGFALIVLGRGLHTRMEVHADDVFVAEQIRDVRYALALYARDQGHYPPRLEDLANDGWIPAQKLTIPGHTLYYHLTRSDRSYELTFDRTP